MATQAIVPVESDPLELAQDGVEKMNLRPEGGKSIVSYIRTSDFPNLCDSLRGSSHEELVECGVLDANAKEIAKYETERWIALDDASPETVRKVMDEMVRYALSLEDLDIWAPAPKTVKLLKDAKPLNATDVWMWIGSVPHKGYGNDIPCVKSRGLVNKSPKQLAELLMDSSRVKTYNKNSQGREDHCVWQLGLANDAESTFGRGETKVTRSINKAPMIRKPLEFISLLHGRKLEDGTHVVVARNVSGPISNMSGKPMVRNEILLNVHVLKPVEGNPNQTSMVNINHLKSPVVPIMVAKKVGLASATNFLKDIRSLK
jgi:hypothetical protein